MFARNTKGWIGFDIGATSVKAAQLVRSGQTYRLHAAAIVPRSERWPVAALNESEARSSADEISAAASLCEHLVGKNAATVLPAGACDLRQIDAPAAKRTGDKPDLVRAIEVETQRSMRDRVFDWWPMSSHGGKINIVIAPRAWSDRVSADVGASGWHCRVIDALPWALARAARLVNPSRSHGPIAALDWAYGRSTVCLVHNGVPTLVRSLKDCGYHSVIAAVASNLRMSEADAETLLHRYGLGSKANNSGVAALDARADTSAASTVIEDIVDQPVAHLALEILRTLDYWRGVTRGQAPETMYIFGGGGAIAGAGPRLTELLGLPVQPWQMPIEEAAWELPLPACLFGAAAGLSALAWEAA
jgi:Tfp pilus assembly PilM family ATPase